MSIYVFPTSYIGFLSLFQNKSSCFTARMKNSPLRSSEALYWHVTEFDRGFNLRLLYWPYWNYIGGRRHRYRCQNSAEVPWDHWQQTFRLASCILKILYPERTHLPGINFSHCFLIPRRTFFCVKHISLFSTFSITKYNLLALSGVKKNNFNTFRPTLFFCF